MNNALWEIFRTKTRSRKGTIKQNKKTGKQRDYKSKIKSGGLQRKKTASWRVYKDEKAEWEQ